MHAPPAASSPTARDAAAPSPDAAELLRQCATARRVDLWALLVALDRAGLARTLGFDADHSFHPSDLSLQSGPEGHSFEVRATFLGLLGPHTPLPEFTLEAVERAPQPLRVLAAIESRLLELLHAALRRCAYPAALSPARDDPSSRRLVDLAARGVADGDLPSRAWLRLVAHAPGRLRTASGLAAALTRMFAADLGDAAITVLECIPSTGPLPESGRSHLGRPSTALGHRFVLGDCAPDADGRFRVRVATLSVTRARAFLRGGDALRRLFAAVSALTGPLLAFDVEVVLAPGAAPRMRLGDPPPRLGVDTWTLNLHRGLLSVRHDAPG